MAKSEPFNPQTLAQAVQAQGESTLETRQKLDQLLPRQVIPAAGGILAIRHVLGWPFVPQEDFAFVLHLLNGFSGHEAGTLNVVEKILRPGDNVIDIGAYIGLLTIPMCRLVGPQGRVYAVEPLPRTAECLRRALISNDLAKRCDILIAAASDANGQTDFYLSANSMMGSLVPERDDQQAVVDREIPLDEWMPPSIPTALIKLDVGGTELRALAGKRRIVAQDQGPCLIAELGPAHLEKVGVELSDWFDAFAAAGFDHRFVIDEATGALSAVDLCCTGERADKEHPVRQRHEPSCGLADRRHHVVLTIHDLAGKLRPWPISPNRRMPVWGFQLRMPGRMMRTPGPSGGPGRAMPRILGH